MFSKKILSLVAMWLLLVLNAFSANKRFTLVIDAGHGGHDAGALGTISKEKDINLSVALAFGRYVERNQPDVRVVYTRKTDVFIPLKERANIANRANADLFISVHTNALPAGKIARGFETYTLGMHRAKDNLDVAMRENSVISIRPQVVVELYHLRVHTGKEYGTKRGTGANDSKECMHWCQPTQ